MKSKDEVIKAYREGQWILAGILIIFALFSLYVILSLSLSPPQIYQSPTNCEQDSIPIKGVGGKSHFNLILDHITPIALGGDEFSRDNVQLLCISCDKKKTKKDHKLIAEARKKHKLKSIGQTTLAV